ncbi:hypothetical protein PT974_06948 [Cladobotryum mycophilum]|uniref:N-acetyltransferase domain-containing protein n=1 Tax=Cladobotryum mycophilum TaxID=491253 RepID=A0ABR0SP53_9HYPO
MPLKLSEVTLDSEFEELTRCQFDAFESPDCRLTELFFPRKGPSPDARDATIQAAAQSQAAWHRADPTSIWLKVMDEDSNKLVGAARWHVYEADPYAVAEEGECDWWPEGEDRNMANVIMEQFLTPRMTYMRKPHVFLELCFTHPDHRRRGVGRMLMEWGIQKADDKGLETYIDATDIGRQLYRPWGFIDGASTEFSLASFAATPRRQELEKQLLPFVWWPMHRPVRGHYEEGKKLLPWEKE